MELKRVVVTGLGTINPLGNTVPEYFSALKNGICGSDMITLFDASKHKTRFACEVKGFDPGNYLDRKEARKLDRYAQLALVAADEAVKNSGLPLDTIDKDRVGVIWASGIGGIGTFLEEVRSYALGDGTPRFGPFFIPKMISDIASGHISIKYGFCGPNYCTVSACASSTHALIDAFTNISIGKADVIVSGGSEAAINEVGMGGFNAMMAISTNNDEYKTASRPFCATRDGFVMGEGAGCIILEEYEHAVKRGAHIYCEMVGTGMTADAHHLTAPHPDGLGAIKVMKLAIQEAGIALDKIDYVNVHGTATPLGDIAETRALVSLFGEHAYKLNISSTKSMTGHLLGAAGVIEAMATILAINTGIIPPTINLKQLDENIDPKLNLTLHIAQERKVDYALSNTFGFGGHNASVIFKKFQQ